MRPAALLLILAFVCGCSQVCAKSWETTSTVGRAWGGVEYSQSATIGGSIGDECKDQK